MSESKFKTMRHIETVRNYLNAVILELLNRAERHDQTKLESPEVEMLCDWKAATMRHNDGNIYKSLEINKERFSISEDLYSVLCNTVSKIEQFKVFHKANES